MLFNPSREQARAFFIDAWHKRQAGLPLSPLEDAAAKIVALHPEYQALLEQADAAQQTFLPEDGQINPFLHLSLHLAVAEQLSVDQPPGICAAYQACLSYRGQAHEALHDVLECLGETIWHAQRNQKPMDAQAYIDAIYQRVQRG